MNFRRNTKPLEFAALVIVSVLLTASLASSTAGALPAPALRQVLWVGNNWDGTADAIESTGTYSKIGRINAIPDKDQRLVEIFTDPIKAALFLGIRETVGEGHDQFVDDMYSTPDGRSVVISRPSFADVVSIDVTTGKINWRFPVSGNRADHMAISPDGKTVAVSASTSNTVHVVDIVTGKQRGQFATGDKPHENVFTKDGKYLWNMAIGDVNNSNDAPWQDFLKGNRYVTIVDATTFKVVRTIDMRKRLDAFGRKDLSNAVRPVAFSPDERTMYFQVSFFGGFIEYDVAADKITRIATLPANPDTNPDRTTWVNDSRHHGISMSGDGTKLCVAGTTDNYATIVDRATLTPGALITASKPYWATVDGTGTRCIISESGSNSVTAIDFATGQKVASTPVGLHPQRVRLGYVPTDWKVR